MKKSFDFYRSTNPRLHNRMDQQDKYNHYLKRIEKIVDKKQVQNTSSSFYMNFLHKTKYTNRKYRQMEYQSELGLENKYLLQKIVHAKQRKTTKPEPNYALAMYQKRYRQQQKINNENKTISKRISEQYSILRKRRFNNKQNSIKQISISKHSERDNSVASWHSKLKERKLPKLLKPLRI